MIEIRLLCYTAESRYLTRCWYRPMGRSERKIYKCRGWKSGEIHVFLLNLGSTRGKNVQEANNKLANVSIHFPTNTFWPSLHIQFIFLRWFAILTLDSCDFESLSKIHVTVTIIASWCMTVSHKIVSKAAVCEFQELLSQTTCSHHASNIRRYRCIWLQWHSPHATCLPLDWKASIATWWHCIML